MKISYAVTVCDEFVEIQSLLAFLLQNKGLRDEVVVLVDLTKNNPTSELLGYLHKLSSNNSIILLEDSFDKHFANWKNKLSKACTGDYIINIDADELPSDSFMESIIQVIKENEEIDVFVVPRWNTVKGLTSQHINQWRWNVDDLGRINWPDYQMRVYRNCEDIQWVNPVHEVLSGFKTFAPLPDFMYINHHKTIQKQEKQNKLYDTL